MNLIPNCGVALAYKQQVAVLHLMNDALTHFMLWISDSALDKARAQFDLNV